MTRDYCYSCGRYPNGENPDYILYFSCGHALCDSCIRKNKKENPKYSNRFYGLNETEHPCIFCYLESLGKITNDKVTIEISRKAADCLAWFVNHDMYPNDLSGIIVQHTTEWAHREHKELTNLYVDGEYKKNFED